MGQEPLKSQEGQFEEKRKVRMKRVKENVWKS
jgi:hypothetical protein